MIESPTAEMIVHSKEADSVELDPSLEKHPLLDVEQTVTLVHTSPITSRIRKTIRHLHAQAGFTARWRGLFPAVVYNIVTALCFVYGKTALDAVAPSVAGVSEYIVGALVAALWVRVHCAWTHATIAMPSSKRLRERIPAVSAWRHLAIPAVNAELATLSSMNLVRILATVVNRYAESSDGDGQWTVLLAYLAIPATAVFLFLFVVLPNRVILTRIEAFLLPEDEDTIVPMDRSLRASVDGATLRARDAWKGFSWQSFRIVAKTYAKQFIITLALAVVAVHFIALEAMFAVGPEMGTLIAAGQERLRRRGLIRNA